MDATFFILAALLVASAVGAVGLRNLVHCALSLTVTLAAVGLLYLKLGAQFAGLAQLLVYIGAVAILIVFAILLTRGHEAPAQGLFSRSWVAGLAVAGVLFLVMFGVIQASRTFFLVEAAAPSSTVREIGNLLMTRYVLALEVTGVLLTAALIGAVVVARGNIVTPAQPAEGKSEL